MISVVSSGLEWHTSFDVPGYVPLISCLITPDIRAQLRDAAAHLHTQGFMIRNLEPERVLVKDNHVLIVDLSEATRIRKAGWCYTTYEPDWYRDPRMVHGGYDETVDFYAIRRFV
jgi:serine/threonine protein kinase